MGFPVRPLPDTLCLTSPSLTSVSDPSKCFVLILLSPVTSAPPHLYTSLILLTPRPHQLPGDQPPPHIKPEP